MSQISHESSYRSAVFHLRFELGLGLELPFGLGLRCFFLRLDIFTHDLLTRWNINL